MQDYVEELRLLIDRGAADLLQIREKDSAVRARPGAWSPREVVGHLIDSASVNHERFVRARLQDDLVFAGYDQDVWVANQDYQNESWSGLITLWRVFNVHIAHLMEVTPESARFEERAKHNLDEIAWKTVPRGEATTLDYFMADYVGHLKQHLRQVLGTEWNPESQRSGAS